MSCDNDMECIFLNGLAQADSQQREVKVLMQQRSAAEGPGGSNNAMEQ